MNKEDTLRKLLVLVGLATCLFLAKEAHAAPGENCPSDWHPPPCGEAPPPVKSWFMTQLKALDEYHFGASQVVGTFFIASCTPYSTGRPDWDIVKKAVCAMSTAVGGFIAGAMIWEQRLMNEINAARDGGTQFVMKVDPPPLASFEIVDTPNTWLNALQYDMEDHRKTVEELGAVIVDSVHTTYLCDQWALYDIDGIICGNNQRAYTAIQLNYIGQRYSAVSAIEDAFLSILLELDADILAEVARDFVAFLDDDSEVNGWEGYNLQ
jgi:hypothetical protein